MTFEQIVPKFIRLPWLQYAGKDAEVASSVAYDCGGMDFFREAPGPENMPLVLHSIATPIVLALHRGTSESLQKRNRWGALTGKEQALVLDTLALKPEQHNAVLQLVVDQDWRFKIASYMAAAFALTTYTKPCVMTYDKFVQVAFSSLSGDTFETKAIRGAGLFILVGTGGPIAGAERVYGFLSSLLSKRQAGGKLHVFMDAPDGKVLVNMMKGVRVSRDDVMGMYQSIFPQSLRIHNLLFGPNVYMDPIDKMESVRNERRQTAIV